MVKHLDIVALRAFQAIVETGGVTRAAHLLNLTQSAVSMQIKRLELSLGVTLFDRIGRGLVLSAEGEQLLPYARKILSYNDMAFEKLTGQDYEGTLKLGVPHDIVPLAIPQVLRAFNAEYPRMRVELQSSFTRRLLVEYQAGELDVILTTEEDVQAGGETLMEMELAWVGAIGGTAHRYRPLRLAFEKDCIFKPLVTEALDEAGLPWLMTIQAENTRTIEATVSADLAITAVLEDVPLPGIENINHSGSLPELPSYKVNLYKKPSLQGPAAERLVALLRQAYPDVKTSSRRPSQLSDVS